MYWDVCLVWSVVNESTGKGTIHLHHNFPVDVCIQLLHIFLELVLMHLAFFNIVVFHFHLPICHHCYHLHLDY